MKFSVNVVAFLKIIRPLIDISQKGVSKEAEGYNKVNISITDKLLNISVFNGKVSVSGSFDNVNIDNLSLEIQEQGNASVDAKYLSEALESFPETNVVIELKQNETAKELYIKDKQDEEQFQTVSCYDAQVKTPDMAKKFSKELIIKRDVFVSAVNRVKFGFGSSETQQNVNYWILRVSKDHLRFMSGNGGFVPILDLDGPDAYQSATPEAFNFIFGNQQTDMIFKLLEKEENTDVITIKESGKGETYQIVLKTKNYDIIMTGLSESISWKDENIWLSMPVEYKAVSRISDWKQVMMGANATFDAKVKNPHKVNVMLDSTKKVMTFKVNGTLKSLRKIPLLDITCPEGKPTSEYMLYSYYLSQIPECYDETTAVQLEFPESKLVVAYFDANEQVESVDKMFNIDMKNGLKTTFKMIIVRTND